MKITISVGGLFHAPPLAKYLTDQGHTVELITSYPKYILKKRNITTSIIKTVFSKEIIDRLYKKLLPKFYDNYLSTKWFDYRASKRISKDSDVYIIWASFGLQTIKKIRSVNKNAIIILERGSAHIKRQDQLLSQAIGKNIINPKILEKECKEYEMTDYISVPSIFSRKSFIDLGFPEDRILVNPYGVDLQEFYSSSNRKTSIFTVGYVGNISAQKNVNGIIKAIDILQGRGLKIRLLLVGNIDVTTFDLSLIKDYNFIEYHKAVPQNELVNYYMEMDVFVLNSIHDGFGMVLLQAMASGLPVIATENSGGPDVIEPNINGFIIPINSDKILAEKIEYLYNHPEQKETMGINARKKVKNGYSWTDYGERYGNILKNLNKRF
jgi:glycosyltransferase involved in cell wall biosynthesis